MVTSIIIHLWHLFLVSLGCVVFDAADEIGLMLSDSCNGYCEHG
jgi:hypothetical protein